MNDEELRLMEIRVTLELPRDVFDEYSELKNKRKLTDHVQTIVNKHENERISGSRVVESDNRFEEAFVNLTNLVSELTKSQELDRRHREDELRIMNERIAENERVMGGVLERVLDRLDNLSVSNVSESVPAPVAPSVPPAISPEMLQMMATIMSAGNVGATNVVVEEEPVVVEEEFVPAPPSKGAQRKMGSMFDV